MISKTASISAARPHKVKVNIVQAHILCATEPFTTSDRRPSQISSEVGMSWRHLIPPGGGGARGERMAVTPANERPASVAEVEEGGVGGGGRE
jgi:hypothetical protein